MSQFKKLYSIDSLPDGAFFMPQGCAYFYISNVDKYAIKGNNLIIGATEIILKKILNIDTQRLETAVSPCTNNIKKISTDKYISAMDSYSFIINSATVLAQQVLETNKIIKKILNELHEHDRQIQEQSILFYQIVQSLSEEYNKRKLPWINEILKKYQNTISFKRGEAFSKAVDSITIDPSNELSENMVEYHRGALICEENTKAEELYILQAGSIDVEIGGNKVATIDEKGTIIGEMALLLNEKRTASLIAKNNTVISIIKKTQLKETVQKQPDLLKKIAISLAQRHYYNLIKIKAINKSIVEKTFDEAEVAGENKALKAEKIKQEVSKLKNEISEAAYKRDADYLKEIIDKHS